MNPSHIAVHFFTNMKASLISTWTLNIVLWVEGVDMGLRILAACAALVLSILSSLKVWEDWRAARRRRKAEETASTV